MSSMRHNRLGSNHPRFFKSPRRPLVSQGESFHANPLETRKSVTDSDKVTSTPSEPKHRYTQKGPRKDRPQRERTPSVEKAAFETMSGSTLVGKRSELQNSTSQFAAEAKKHRLSLVAAAEKVTSRGGALTDLTYDPAHSIEELQATEDELTQVAQNVPTHAKGRIKQLQEIVTKKRTFWPDMVKQVEEQLNTLTVLFHKASENNKKQYQSKRWKLVPALA